MKGGTVVFESMEMARHIRGTSVPTDTPPVPLQCNVIPASLLSAWGLLQAASELSSKKNDYPIGTGYF
jgi:hypothetical protein